MEEYVDVVAPPVPAVREPAPVETVGRVVLVGGDTFGVKIIVHVNPVHVVAACHIEYDARDIRPDIRETRVEHLETSDREYPPGMLDGHMRGVYEVLSDRVDSPVGVEPGVQLHAPLVRLVNDELKRVERRLGRSPLRPREPVGPWFDRGLVQCIALRTDLEYHRIEPRPVKPVEYRHE